MSDCLETCAIYSASTTGEADRMFLCIRAGTDHCQRLKVLVSLFEIMHNDSMTNDGDMFFLPIAAIVCDIRLLCLYEHVSGIGAQHDAHMLLKHSSCKTRMTRSMDDGDNLRSQF